jgi:hypothetical protein
MRNERIDVFFGNPHMFHLIETFDSQVLLAESLLTEVNALDHPDYPVKYKR